jgi:hypothetical protein
MAAKISIKRLPKAKAAADPCRHCGNTDGAYCDRPVAVANFCPVCFQSANYIVSDAPDDMVKAFHMTPAQNLDEALNMADTVLKKPQGTILAIPDGVSVIVE